MKAHYDRTFEYGQKIVKYLLILVIVLGLASALLVPQNSTAQWVLVIAAFAMIAAALFVIYKYCRCPYCGKRIFGGVLAVKSCPKCRRNLVTGKKVKK